MKINTINDFVELINYIQTETPTQTKHIDTDGLSKFKESVYEVLQYIDNSFSIENLSPGKRNLYDALIKLKPEERTSLSQSMLTSYYTPDYIVDATTASINKYLDNSNLSTISICEPSAGSGNFLKNIVRENRTIDAVELDLFTSKILKNNFPAPNVTVHNIGYENLAVQKKYDLVLGNVPFGNYNVYDKNLSAEDKNIINGKIHNYFFHKSIENLKPGGVLMLLTTAAMNNSLEDKKIREYMMKETNLVSCVRFSDATFSKSNTKVVSDLVVLQKPLSPKTNFSEREKSFINTTPSDEKETFLINEYLKNNPSNVLGDLYLTSGFLGREILSVKDNQNLDLPVLLSQILEKDFESHSLKRLLDIPLSPSVQEVNVSTQQISNDSILEKYPHVIPGNIIVENNEFFKVIVNQKNSNLLDKVSLLVDLKNREKLLAVIELRDSYKELRSAIRKDDRPLIKSCQNILEDKYNSFSFFYDTLNSKSNSVVLNYDVESDMLRGLEIPEKGYYIKSDIFLKDFSKVEETKVTSDTLQDAIALSFHTYGKLSQEYITSIYNTPAEVWIKEALEKELLYVNPLIENLKEIKGYELAIPSKFKSGYVEGKFAIYKNSSLLLKDNEFSSLFDKSTIEKAVSALISATPFKLNISEINPGMGEPWVDNRIYELFGKEHLQDERFKITYTPALDKYTIQSGYSKFASANYSVETSKNVNYSKIFEFALAHNIPDYKKTIFSGGSEIKVVDKETINAVNLSVEKLNKEFTSWLLTKPELCKTLEETYHLLNNAIVKENYNVSLLDFSEIKGKTPYEHQKNAVWQNINQMGGIIDHEVGFGKSMTMAMSTMKKKQFGFIKKELVAGLNANYKALHETYKEIYPTGKFLLVEPDDLAPAKKQETFYKIANNDWDAVITAHSCLSKFPPAPYAQQKILGETISELKATILEVSESKVLSRGQVNDLNKRLLDAETNFKYATDVINDKKEKGSLIFDDLGFDSMTVDESHEFKNLSFATKHSRIAGLGNQSEVQKTSNLLSYVRHIQGVNGGDKGVTFASGTTISNSITELYLLFKYLRPTMLEEKGMNTFDQWARVFARKTNEYEESVTGQIKQKERFRYFVKVPELAKMYNDITNYADFNTYKIERPLAEIQLIPIEPYKEQLDYFERIKEFGQTKNIGLLHSNRSGDPSKASKAVGLICTAEGRKASLSMKLIDSSFADNPSDKINTMTDVALEHYHKFNSVKGVQLIFCDQGVPGGTNFNLYQYTKDLLVTKGVDSKEIAFIHDWDKKRESLFTKVNSGEIRFLLGSTTKMGVGVNVQQRIVAMHHLDFPWRPTDMVQRNGRGERPGNVVLPSFGNKLPIFFYATKQSLDSYTFNLLQIKHNFILQIKNASVTTRTIDEGLMDVNGGMNFSQYMAACSSNQYLTQKLEVEKKLNLVVDLKNTHELNYRKNFAKVAYITADIEKATVTVSKLENDNLLSKKVVQSNYDTKLFSSDPAAVFYLRSQLEKKFILKDYALPVTDLGYGFKLMVYAKIPEIPIDRDNYKLLLLTPNNYKIGYKSNTFTKDDIQVAAYASNCIAKIETLLSNEKGKIADCTLEKNIIEKSLENRLDKGAEILALKEQIAKLDVLIEKENSKNDPKPEDKDQDNKNNNKKGRGI